eukprot:5785620-Amphidinium_carterae.2
MGWPFRGQGELVAGTVCLCEVRLMKRLMKRIFHHTLDMGKDPVAVATSCIHEYVKTHSSEAPSIWLAIQSGLHKRDDTSVAEAPYFSAGITTFNGLPHQFLVRLVQ